MEESSFPHDRQRHRSFTLVEALDQLLDEAIQSVRELLMSVVKHAKVPVATVWMRVTGDEMVQVTVKDQGPGFTFLPERLRAPGHHFGLRSIQETLIPSVLSSTLYQ